MRRVLLGLALALTCRPVFAEAALRVVYDTTVTETAGKGASSPGDKVSRDTMTGVLTPSAIQVRRGEQ